jgi:hypothetical protein
MECYQNGKEVAMVMLQWVDCDNFFHKVYKQGCLEQDDLWTYKQLEAQWSKIIGNAAQRHVLKLVATITTLTSTLFTFYEVLVMHLITWAIEHDLNDGHL